MCLSRVCVCVCVCVCVRARALSRVRFFATPWTVAWHVPLSMEFSRQEYWTGLPFPTPEDLPDPEIEPTSLALAGGFFTTMPLGKPPCLGHANKQKQIIGGGGRLKHFALVKFINHSKCSSILSSCFLWGNFCSFFRFGELLFLTEPPELRTLNCKLVLCPSCLPALSGHTWAGNVILR